jgi:hypothetical protein
MNKKKKLDNFIHTAVLKEETPFKTFKGVYAMKTLVTSLSLQTLHSLSENLSTSVMPSDNFS